MIYKTMEGLGTKDVLLITRYVLRFVLISISPNQLTSLSVKKGFCEHIGIDQGFKWLNKLSKRSITPLSIFQS